MAGLQHDAWVLVCDGRKALLLQNKGDAAYPKLEARAELVHEDLPTHELGTDAPGRTFSSADGGRRAAMEPTDLHAIEEERFLKHVTERVNRDAGEKRFKHLVVVAPPRALAVLRRALSPAARAAVAAEFDKDLVRFPVYEIEKHLQKMLSERT